MMRPWIATISESTMSYIPLPDLKKKLIKIAKNTKNKRTKAVTTWLVTHGWGIVSKQGDLFRDAQAVASKRQVTSQVVHRIRVVALETKSDGFSRGWLDRLAELLSRDLKGDERFALDLMRENIIFRHTTPSVAQEEYLVQLVVNTEPSGFDSLNTRAWFERLKELKALEREKKIDGKVGDLAPKESDWDVDLDVDWGDDLKDLLDESGLDVEEEVDLPQPLSGLPEGNPERNPEEPLDEGFDFGFE